MKDRTLALLGTGSIPYRKELREYTGSVTGSLLMMQLDYWFARHPDGFYKFLDPTPNHPDYKEGDSWTEELGFSKAEFRSAFDAIGVRHSSKSAYMRSPNKFTGQEGEKFYCSYHDKKNGLTWYFRNHPKVEQLITDLCKAKPVKHRVKPSSVDKQTESTGHTQTESPVDKESESTVDVVSESIEVNNVDLHRSTNLTYINQESESTFYIQKIPEDYSDTTSRAPLASQPAHPHPSECVEIPSQESTAISMNHLLDDSLILNSTNPSNFDQQDQLNTPLDDLSSDVKSNDFIGQKNNISHEGKFTRRENDSQSTKSVKTDEYWLERIDTLEEELQEYCDRVQGRLTSKGINRCSSSSDPWMKGANVRMEIVEFIVTMKERELIGRKTTYQPTMPNIRSEIKNDYERGRDYYAAYIKSLHFKNLNQVQQQQPKPNPVVDTASAIADYEKISKSEHFEILGRAFMDYRRLDAFLLEHPHRKPWVEWMITTYQDQMRDHHKKFLELAPTEPPKEIKPGFEKFSILAR